MDLRNWWSRIGIRDAFSRRQIAARWLAGNGLEIGALDNPLHVPRRARVTYVDRKSRADVLKEFPKLAKRPLIDPKIIDHAETLATVPNESQDFLIANHLIEHIENPIAAIETFLRVLRPGAVLYLTIPDMRTTFDASRKETTVAHLLRDYREGPEWSRADHYDDFALHVHKFPESTPRAQRIEEMIKRNANIHFHCWSQAGMWAWLNALQVELGFPFEIEFYLHRKNEGIFILQKSRGSASSRAAA